MEEPKMTFIQEMKDLFSSKIIVSSLNYRIIGIKEDNIEEYCLTLELDNECIIEGIYIKTKNILKLNEIITKCIIVLDEFKSEIQIKEIINYGDDKNLKKVDALEITKYNLKPEKLLEFFFSIKCFKEKFEYEDIFIIFKSEDKLILKNPITLKNYTLNHKYLKKVNNLKDKDFIYLKNYLYNKNNEIICINLTKVEKASEYIIFKFLDNYIICKYLKEINELRPILDYKKYNLMFLFSKVVLKNINDKLIIIMDKFNRLIEIDYEIFKDLKLFDLLFISNCEIQKSGKDEYFYKLNLTNNSLYYSTNELIFNKNISINNYTILDIKIPDYNENNNNILEKIIINKDYEFKINKNRIVCIFKFNNQEFNEIVPFKIKCMINYKIYKFKFLITHNLINNINLFANNNNENRCCIDYCYWNFAGKAPYSIKYSINNNKYTINHSNSFNSTNRVGFILINVPSNEKTDMIKKETNKKIISAQIWNIKDNFSSDKYVMNQILNVEEIKPKEYENYGSMIKNYSKYENIYSYLSTFMNNLNENEKEINKYYEEFYESIYKVDKKKIESFINKDNIDFDPNSADYYVFKIYLNILLFYSLEKIKDENKKIRFDKWNKFIKLYFNLNNQLIDLKNEITFHQKIRILSSYANNYLGKDKDFERIPCRFFYINKKIIDRQNSYYLALEFNKNIINNLTENSALTKGYNQIDSNILKNYLLEKIENTYTFSNEPLELMKYHLIMNYDNFIFINNKKPKINDKFNAEQDRSNRITYINELCLFNAESSEYFTGKNTALPIFMEFFHEKDSHSKKYFKNLKINSPTVYYTDETHIRDEPKDGKFIQSLIGDENFIKNLKDHENNLGELMEVKYFIDNNFNKLHEKYKEIMSSKVIKKDKKVINKNIKDLIINNEEQVPINNKKINKVNKKISKEKKLETLEDFENEYLVKGIFVYPDSLPIHQHKIGEQPKPLSPGEKAYLDKYKDIFEEAEKEHLKKIKF